MDRPVCSGLGQSEPHHLCAELLPVLVGGGLESYVGDSENVHVTPPSGSWRLRGHQPIPVHQPMSGGLPTWRWPRTNCSQLIELACVRGSPGARLSGGWLIRCSEQKLQWSPEAPAGLVWPSARPW